MTLATYSHSANDALTSLLFVALMLRAPLDGFTLVFPMFSDVIRFRKTPRDEVGAPPAGVELRA